MRSLLSASREVFVERLAHDVTARASLGGELVDDRSLSVGDRDVDALAPLPLAPCRAANAGAADATFNGGDIDAGVFEQCASAGRGIGASKTPLGLAPCLGRGSEFGCFTITGLVITFSSLTRISGGPRRALTQPHRVKDPQITWGRDDHKNLQRSVSAWTNEQGRALTANAWSPKGLDEQIRMSDRIQHFVARDSVLESTVSPLDWHDPSSPSSLIVSTVIRWSMPIRRPASRTWTLRPRAPCPLGAVENRSFGMPRGQRAAVTSRSVLSATPSSMCWP